MTSAGPRTHSSRHGSATRIAQVIAAAEAILIERGTLPLPIREVGNAVGASRALVYSYFPDGAALVEAVLAEQFADLEKAGIREAGRSGALIERALACANIYIRHVAVHGPVIHIILRDREQLQLAHGTLRLRHALARTLARTARQELALTAREALVMLELLLVIAEEAGRLVYRQELSLEEALHTSSRLIASGIDSMRPNGLGPA